MIRALGIRVLLMGCLTAVTVAKAEPRDDGTPPVVRPADPGAGRDATTPTLQRAVNGARSAGANVASDNAVVVTPSDVNLPPRVQTVCAKAKGDLAFMCGEFERLYRQTEQRNLEAAKKLQQLTRGGVIEVLQ